MGGSSNDLTADLKCLLSTGHALSRQSLTSICEFHSCQTSVFLHPALPRKSVWKHVEKLLMMNVQRALSVIPTCSHIPLDPDTLSRHCGKLVWGWVINAGWEPIPSNFTDCHVSAATERWHAPLWAEKVNLWGLMTTFKIWIHDCQTPNRAVELPVCRCEVFSQQQWYVYPADYKFTPALWRK